MKKLLLLVALGVGVMPLAEARPRPPRRVVVVAPPRPVVVVRVSPWVVSYHPDPRPGYHWVPGHYDPYGRWVPGHWVPDAPRPGYLWVPGHWVNDQYVDGYWREELRPGFIWVDGYYDGAGAWIPGYWAPDAPPPPPAAPPVYHVY
jgi:hypothetical protein